MHGEGDDIGLSQSSNSARHMTLGLCALLHAFTHAYMMVLCPLILRVQEDLGLASRSQAMSLLTIYSLVYCGGCLPAGALADRISRRTALAFGLLLNGLAFAAIFYCKTYGQMVAALTCGALGGSLYHPSATALLVSLYPNRPGRAIGIAGMGAALGYAFGPWFGGWRSQALGWRQPCLELGVAGIAVAIVFWAIAKNHPRAEDAPHHQEGGATALSMLLFFLAISLVFSLRDFGGAGVKPLCTVFFEHVHDFTEEQTGRYFGLMSLTALIANPLFGAWSDRRRIPVAVGLLVCAGLGAAAIPWADGPFMLVPLIALEFFLLASFPVVEAALAESVPDRMRGRIQGLFTTVSGLIGGTSPYAMGWITDALGRRVSDQAAYRVPFLVLGSCVAASSLGLLVLRAFRRRAATPNNG